MPYKGPMGRFVALLAAALWLTGCASGPYDLVPLTPTPTYRASEKPLGPVHVRLETDRRPPRERGVRKYPGRSYLGGNARTDPTGVSLLRVLARDLEVAGVGREAGLMARDEVGCRDQSFRSINDGLAQDPGLFLSGDFHKGRGLGKGVSMKAEGR